MFVTDEFKIAKRYKSSFLFLMCSKEKTEKQIVIGASLLTMQDDFYITLNQGLLDAAAEAKDYNIKVLSRNADFKLGKQIADIEDFVQQFIKAVIAGILGALKGYREAQDIRLSIDGDAVDITVDSDVIQLNPFVSTFVRNTVIGMVSSLKDVGQIERLEISIS